jgi:tetratricopeptide (TPR) repeat protein
MKKYLLMLSIMGASLSSFVCPHTAAAYNFGDFRSETLVGKAWTALNENNIEAVLAYTNKCIELYGAKAKEMQESLKDYVTESKDKVFSMWALNDVSTALFIQGEAYRKANMMDEAKAAYQKVIDEFSFGQTWDPKGWFWKPAEAAKEKLAMIESGSKLDYGDNSSSFLTGQAWKALNDNPEDVASYVKKVIDSYADKAKEMQSSLTEYPWESKEKIFSYWALNDVGTALYIQGMADKKLGKKDEAKTAFKKLIDEYSFAQCWDPQGWFWKPAEAAQQEMDSLEE